MWAAYLAVMRLLSSMNQRVKYLLCQVDVFTTYSWIKTSKDKKTETALNGFIETVNKSKRKPNKLWNN